MRRRIAWVWVVLCCTGSGQAGPLDEKVSLERLSYAQLAEIVTGLKGKVVLVDLWAEFCLPCKKEFPHFVALQRRYADSGLAAISVSLDDPGDAEARQRVVDFLNEQKATCRNVLLTDSPKVWQAKWKIVGPPCVFLFDRQGKLIQRWEGKDINYAVIEQRLTELLKE